MRNGDLPFLLPSFESVSLAAERASLVSFRPSLSVRRVNRRRNEKGVCSSRFSSLGFSGKKGKEERQRRKVAKKKSLPHNIFSWFSATSSSRPPVSNSTGTMRPRLTRAIGPSHLAAAPQRVITASAVSEGRPRGFGGGGSKKQQQQQISSTPPPPAQQPSSSQPLQPTPQRADSLAAVTAVVSSTSASKDEKIK